MEAADFDLSFNRYYVQKHEEKVYDKPAVILERWGSLVRDIADGIEDLKNEVGIR